MGSWKRTFRVVWLANLVTSIGMMSFIPFFPSLLEEMGVTDPVAQRRWAGVLFGAAPFGATIMSPIWGALGDRVGRKLMICRAMIAIALFVGGMAFASGPWTLLALRLGQGFFSGFIPPSMTLVTSLVPADRAGRTTGALTTSLAVGAVIGPTLGGFLASAFGSRQSVFLFVGAAALFSAVLVALFAQEDPTQRQTIETAGQPIREAFAGIRRDIAAVLNHGTMRATAILIFTVQFGLGAVNPLLELFVGDMVKPAGLSHWTAPVLEWGVSVKDGVGSLFGMAPGTSAITPTDVATFATGLAFGVMAIANLVSLKAWGSYGDRTGHRQALLRCALGCILGLAITIVASNYTMLLVGRIVMGVAMAGVGPLAFGLAAAEVEGERRGSAFGVVFSARTMAIALGGAIGGYSASWFGERVAFTLAGLVVVAGWLYFRSTSTSQSPTRTSAVASTSGKADRSS
tara:strand:- start:992 stop:2368 length:1377 start_codon:yes stop_codon:yes gene_type:complete